LLELALHALVVVELAVDDDVEALVLVRDRLIAGMQVDDAEPRMPEADAAMRGDPLPAAVRPAMIEALRRPFQRLRVDRTAAGKERDDAAHCALVLLQKTWMRPARSPDAASSRSQNRVDRPPHVRKTVEGCDEDDPPRVPAHGCDDARGD